MKNSLKLFFYASFAFILLSFSILNLRGPIELILGNLDTYASTYSPNKIYLQTDRSTYAVEDTVWFKAYTLDATQHFSTSDGKIIYIDILDANGEKVTSKKLYTENVGTASDFVIGRDWIPGRYKLRAYTQFMLNHDQALIFNKEIQIVDINKTPSANFISLDSVKSENATTLSPSLEINFFPEGGDLIAGIDSRVAIKIENYSAHLGDLSGTIQDKSGNHVALFKIFERGYGLASFRPLEGKKYFARLDSNPKLYPLPEVKAKGYNILTFSKSDNISIIISSNVKSGLTGGDLVIHSRGRLVFHEKLHEIDNDSYSLQFNTKEIPSGVTHITFFDKDGIPRTERLFFVNNDLSESVINTDKSLYSRREQVDIGLSVINGDSKLFDCSISVSEKSILKGVRSFENIKSWMLLNSDLRGEIQDPTFYFEKTGDRQRAALLDLVIMTHGWSRFTWEDMSQEAAFKNLEYEREEGLYVKGYTSRLRNSKKAIKSTVMLNFLNNNSSQEVLDTEDDGRFSFGPFFLEDSIAAIIQARRYNEKKEKDFLDANNKLKINLDPPPSFKLKKPDFEEDTDFASAPYQVFIANNKVAQALKDQTFKREVQLAEVVLTAKRTDKEDKMNKRVSDISFYGKPSNRVTVQDKDRVRNISVFDMLREVPGVTVTGSYPNHSIIIRAASSIYVDPTPMFMVDGVTVGLDYVSRMSTNDVWFIDVIKGSRSAIFGVRGGNGVIAIYTGRPSELNVTKRETGIVDISIKGFDKYREFYSPDYSKNISSVNKPDVRTTLYWNPYILLSKDKESSISFFTGDNIGEYIITLEGLSENGEPIFGAYEFRIQ